LKKIPFDFEDTQLLASSETCELSRSLCENGGMGLWSEGLVSSHSDVGKISIETSPEQYTRTTDGRR